MADAAVYDMKPENILECVGLDISFGGMKAVDDFSVSIQKGEIYGLIGPNGAGKTTVFNMLTRFYTPDSGHVYLRNLKGDVVDLTTVATHKVVEQGLARTFQNIELIKDLSLVDNILVGGHVHFKSSLFSRMLRLPKALREEKALRDKALSLMAFFGIEPLAEHLAAGQPYGVLKKSELARAMLAGPSLLILDEPAAGLNDEETVELATLIRQINSSYHCTILLIEHDMRLVMDICDRICAISFGKTLAIGTPNEIKNSPVVQEAYLGEVENE